MKIVVVAPAVNTGAERGFYNRQEVGLARGLAGLGHEVTVLKTVPQRHPSQTEDLGPRARLVDVPTRTVGSHGLVSLPELEAMRPEAVVLFADLQLCVPSVGRWCRRRAIPLVKVVGTMETNREGRALLSQVTRWRNLREYRRSPVVAKTPAMAETLRCSGIKASVVPVGLDTTTLRPPTPVEREEAREARGLPSGEPVLGFVGNLAPYKSPMTLVPLLQELRKRAPWRLLMVGDGPLSGELEAAFRSVGLQDAVRRELRVPNDAMNCFYGAVDVLVNLNPSEIFGMAIVESMFCGTPVVAVDAPGPSFIIRDNIDGRLTSSDPAELAGAIQEVYGERATKGANAQQRVAESFTWEASARSLVRLLEEART